MKATWVDLESDSEEDVDSANVCFMAQGETSSKVTSKPTLDDSELTLDELGFAFQELDEKYISLKFQYSRLKKENDFLKEELNVVSKKRENY